MASNGEEDDQERSRSLEDLRSMRLMALLQDVNREHGTMRAAKLLGVNHKTVTRAMASGAVSGRMRHAPELMLLAGGGSAAARQRERTEALEREMAVLRKVWEEREEALPGMMAEEVRVAVEAGGEALRSELRQGMEALSTRVLSPETVPSSPTSPAKPGDGHQGAPCRRGRALRRGNGHLPDLHRLDYLVALVSHLLARRSQACCK